MSKTKEEQDIIRGIKQTVVIWSILFLVTLGVLLFINAGLNR